MSFRTKYLTHEEITAQLETWTRQHPDLVRLASIGKTPEGRDLWVVTIGADPDRIRPAVWIDANMHATELCGSSVALAIAEDVIALQRGQLPAHLADVPAPILERVRDVVFHVMPRMSPDGAEVVMRTGRYVRSVPRDARPDRKHPRWINEDIDGDGLALVMRVVDPCGEYVDSPDAPGVLVPRELGDAGPFYRLYPEGRIEHFDGINVPPAIYLCDNEPDLNRNFPMTWMPEPEQIGAGRFTLSEPESRAVVEFTAARPNIFGWLNLHTYGGCFIRPAGDKPDNKMDADDLGIYREIGEYCEKLTGYPMVSGYEQFTYEPDKPLRGDLSEWAYSQRGCISYVCELWDVFKRLDMPRPPRFVDYYNVLSRADAARLAKLDREINQARIFVPWRKVQHPQLGEVEVGGIDPRVGISNPPLELIDEVCRAQSKAWMYTASLVPRVRITSTRVVKLGGDVSRVDVVVDNEGYLATHGLPSAKKLPWNEPLWAEATAHNGLALAQEGDARRELGHLDGWGRGKGTGAGAVWFHRSSGTTSRRVAQFVVKGSGLLSVEVGSCRVGAVRASVEVA